MFQIKSSKTIPEFDNLCYFMYAYLFLYIFFALWLQTFVHGYESILQWLYGY